MYLFIILVLFCFSLFLFVSFYFHLFIFVSSQDDSSLLSILKFYCSYSLLVCKSYNVLIYNIQTLTGLSAGPVSETATATT